MTKNYSQSRCTRCGKRRVFVSSKTRKVGNSEITVSDTVCEDKECQAMVDMALQKEATKRAQMISEKENKGGNWKRKLTGAELIKAK